MPEGKGFLRDENHDFFPISGCTVGFGRFFVGLGLNIQRIIEDNF